MNDQICKFFSWDSFFFFGKKRIFKDKTLARVSYLSIIGVLNWRNGEKSIRANG